MENELKLPSLDEADMRNYLKKLYAEKKELDRELEAQIIFVRQNQDEIDKVEIILEEIEAQRELEVKRGS